MELEDKVLQVIQRAPCTYDQLRSQLGVAPNELDEALANVERSRAIVRDRGRFRLRVPAGGEAPHVTPTAIAEIAPPPTVQEEVEAAMAKKKPCKKCGVEKPLNSGNFQPNEGCKDGFEGQCKECKAKYHRERRLALAKPRASQPDTSAAHRNTPALPPPAGSPTKQSGQLMVINIESGFRVGPVVAAASGLQQMPYYVDLTAAMLDDLTAWWAAARKGAA